MKKLFELIVCVTLITGLPAFADVDRGLDAYKSGDYATALREFSPLAEQGNARAQKNLGRMYENGKGVKQDYHQAAKWYRKAVEHGSSGAHFFLANLYYNGRGVPKDYVLAYMWYNLVVSKGVSGGEILRDIVEKQMTPEQIAEAQKLTRECIKNNYEGC